MTEESAFRNLSELINNSSGHKAVEKFLLARRNDLTPNDIHQVLASALSNCSPDVLDLLLGFPGVDANYSPFGLGLLQSVIKRYNRAGNREYSGMIKVLLRRGADPNGGTATHSVVTPNPLMLLARTPRRKNDILFAPSMTKALLDAGADRTLDLFGENALHFTVGVRDFEGSLCPNRCPQFVLLCVLAEYKTTKVDHLVQRNREGKTPLDCLSRIGPMCIDMYEVVFVCRHYLMFIYADRISGNHCSLQTLLEDSAIRADGTVEIDIPLGTLVLDEFLFLLELVKIKVKDISPCSLATLRMAEDRGYPERVLQVLQQGPLREPLHRNYRTRFCLYEGMLAYSVVQFEGPNCLHRLLKRHTYGRIFKPNYDIHHVQRLVLQLKYAMDFSPSSIITPDENNLLPLQVACQEHHSETVVYVLLRRNPESLSMVCPGPPAKAKPLDPMQRTRTLRSASSSCKIWSMLALLCFCVPLYHQAFAWTTMSAWQNLIVRRAHSPICLFETNNDETQDHESKPRRRKQNKYANFSKIRQETDPFEELLAESIEKQALLEQQKADKQRQRKPTVKVQPLEKIEFPDNKKINPYDPATFGYIEVGHVIGAHGVHGWLKITSTTDFPMERLCTAGIRHLKPPNKRAPRQVILIQGKHRLEDEYLIQLQDVDDRDEASKLRGATLYVRQEEKVLPSPSSSNPVDTMEAAIAAEEYIVSDLVNVEVLDQQSNNLVGRVGGVVLAEDMCSVPGLGQDLLEVTLQKGPMASWRDELVLIPFVPQIVPKVDLKEGKLWINPPAGLLDLTYFREERVRLKGFLPPSWEEEDNDTG
jgi:16S rRNA processing protein RimM